MPRPMFPTYSSASGWNAMLPPRRPQPPPEGDLDVDFAVIGAGFTGLAIARRLQEIAPRARIAVLEAITVGEGASARNSGFTSPQVLPRNATMVDAEKARNQSALFVEAFDWLSATIAGHGIACDLQKVGAIRAAATEAGEAALRNTIEVACANGIGHTVLDRAGIAARTGADYYRFGVHIDDYYLLQPAALIRGLADSLPPGVALHENTPVLGLSRAGPGGGWELRTATSRIRAGAVALANNSFIRRFGYLQLRMATIYTYAAITQAVPARDLGQLGDAPSWGVLPAHRLGTTLRRIGRDRLMVRSLYALESEVDHDTAIRKLRDRFTRRWPGLAQVGFDHVWSGTTALTLNGAPCWGQLEEGLFASGGCNGSGITKGTMLGWHLAGLMTGTSTPDVIPRIMGTPGLIAPEPLRSIGFGIISTLESRKAGLEA